MRKRLPVVTPRKHFNVTIRQLSANSFAVSGPGGIQRRERKKVPRWVLQALTHTKVVEARASVDRAGRWCIARETSNERA
jgi:hypothetical protein